MQLKFNGLVQQAAENLITFSDVPNILDISDTTGGTHAILTLTVNNNWYSATTANNQWWLTFQNETISNVLDVDNAVNKNFLITNSNYSTAVNICSALRSCPSISSKFKIYTSTESSPKVYLKAREVGTIDLTVSMASGMTTYITTATTAGTSSTILNNAKVNVDVYSNDEYVTSLEKIYYEDCRFNLSPVLATLAKTGETTPYSLYVSATNDSGTTAMLGNITGNYVSVGYMVNQGNPYLTLSSGITLAQNVSRGKPRVSENNTILYVYQNTIPVYFYTTTTGSLSYTITYRDSALSVISTTSTSTTIDTSVNKLAYIEPTLSIPSTCFYVDITIGDKMLRYNVIKPLNTSYGCQRIEFVNSYGGVSFVDMVGEKSIDNTSETQTYNKNLLDYYETQTLERERVYNTDIKTTYTIKSHLMAEDGRWTYYDLLESPYAWTMINGKKYVIIIESVTASEVNNQGVYEVTVKFRISQPTSL